MTHDDLIKLWIDEDSRKLANYEKKLDYIKHKSTVRRINGHTIIASSLDKIIKLMEKDIKNDREQLREYKSRIQYQSGKELF